MKKMNFETVFFETQWNKRRLKQFLKKCTCLLPGDQTRALAENLKHAGYDVSTHAGLSLNIEDLKVPGCKPALSRFTRASLTKNEIDFFNAGCHQEHGFGFLTSLWNTSGELLKREVVKCFQNDDALNPVFLMAFSGARGNLSQIRQLVGLRGLMTDPNNNVVPYGLTSNFREGLSLTEYIVSCSGARKGVIDTALRTATSGYLTRRLVDVAHHMVVERWDCKSSRSLSLPFSCALKSKNKPGNFMLAYEKHQTRKGKQNAKPNHGLLGRVLKQNVLNQHGQICGTVNQEINMALLLKACLPSGLRVRSPCTCDLGDHVCRLCYGWNHDGLLVSLGECVGILACQSIGEPGTQLTMRTFHTGGVFSGESSNALYAPQAGFVFFQKPILGQMAWNAYHQQSGFLTKQNGVLSLVSCVETPDVAKPKSNPDVYVLALPSYSFIFAKHGLKIEAGFLLAELFAPETCFGHRQDVFAFSSPYEGVFLNTCAQVVKHEPPQRENAFWKQASLSIRFGYFQPLWDLRGMVKSKFMTRHRDQNWVFEKTQAYAQTRQSQIPPDLSGKKKKALVTLGLTKTHRFDFNWASYDWFQTHFGRKRGMKNQPQNDTMRYDTWFGLTLDHNFDASFLHLKQIRWRFGFRPIDFSYRPDRNRFMSQFHDTRFWVLSARKLNMLCDPCDLVFKPHPLDQKQTPPVPRYHDAHDLKACAHAHLKKAFLNVVFKKETLTLYGGGGLKHISFESLRFKVKTKTGSGLKRVFGKHGFHHAMRVLDKRQKPYVWFKNQPEPKLKTMAWQGAHAFMLFFGFTGLKPAFLRAHVGVRDQKPGLFPFVLDFRLKTVPKLETGLGWVTQKTGGFKHKGVLHVSKNQHRWFFAFENPTAPLWTMKQTWFSKTCFLEIQVGCLNVMFGSDPSGKGQPCFKPSTKKRCEKHRASRLVHGTSRSMFTLKNPFLFKGGVKTRSNMVNDPRSNAFASAKLAQNPLDSPKERGPLVFPCLSVWAKTPHQVERKHGQIKPPWFVYDINTFWNTEQNPFHTCGFDFFPFLNLCRPKRKKQACLDFGLKQKQSLFFQNRFSWCLAHPVFNTRAFLNPPCESTEPGFRGDTHQGMGLNNHDGLAKRFFSDLGGVWHLKTWFWRHSWPSKTYQKSFLFSHAVFARAQKDLPFKPKAHEQKQGETHLGRWGVFEKTQPATLVFKHGQSQVRKANVRKQSAKTPFWSHAYARYGLQTCAFKQILKTSFEVIHQHQRLNMVQIQNGFKPKSPNHALSWRAKANRTQVDQDLNKSWHLGTSRKLASKNQTKQNPRLRFWFLKARAKEAWVFSSKGEKPIQTGQALPKATQEDGLNTQNPVGSWTFPFWSEYEKENQDRFFWVQTGVNPKPFCAHHETQNQTYAPVSSRQRPWYAPAFCFGVLQGGNFGFQHHHYVGHDGLLAKAREAKPMRLNTVKVPPPQVVNHDEETQTRTKPVAKRKGFVFGVHAMKPLVFHEVLSKTRFANLKPDTVVAKRNKTKFAKPNMAFFEPRLHRVALSSEHLLQFQPASLNAFCGLKHPTPQKTQNGVANQDSGPAWETGGLEKSKTQPERFFSRFGVGTLLPYGFRWQKTGLFLHGGQIWFLSSKTVVLRQGRQFFMPQRCFSFKTHFDFVPYGSHLFRGLSKRVLRGDITQGILKVERLFEMRLDYDLNFGLREALRHGYHAWNGPALNVLVQRRVILKLNALAQTYALRQIQNVYMDVGVNILDKHVELILKQMTSRARIRRGFRFGFFSGDYVHLSSLNLSLGFCVLNPGLNGLTKTSFLAPGFLSPASFQETKSVLANRSFLAHDDFLSGLKENVVCGRRLNMGLNVQHLFKQGLKNTFSRGLVSREGFGDRQSKFAKPKTDSRTMGLSLYDKGKKRFKFRVKHGSHPGSDPTQSVSINRILRHVKFMQMKTTRYKSQPKLK